MQRTPAPGRATRSARLARLAAGALLVPAALAALALLVFGGPRIPLPELPRWSENQVRDQLYASLQREASEAFLITGRLDVTAAARVSDTRTLLPGFVDLSLGTTRSEVRVPGRVFYGIDLTRLAARDLRVAADGTVELDLPPLQVKAVEPMLARLEVETEVGWARRAARSGQTVERRAVSLVGAALRRQGMAHLRDSDQPELHTARALAALLTPVLLAAGVPEPRFVIRSGDLVVRIPGA